MASEVSDSKGVPTGVWAEKLMASATCVLELNVNSCRSLLRVNAIPASAVVMTEADDGAAKDSVVVKSAVDTLEASLVAKPLAGGDQLPPPLIPLFTGNGSVRVGSPGGP